MPKSKCNHADLPPTNVTCPECKKGKLEVARGRFGPIYKCTNKSECKFYLPDRPTGKTCDFLRGNNVCNAQMVVGTKTIPDRCSNKACPNRNPHKLQKIE